MTFIYAVQITPDTQEDVNQAFREANIPAELLVGEGGNIFVAPVLSWSAWQHFPQSETETGQIDSNWNDAVASGLKHMSDNGWLSSAPGTPSWLEFKVSMRCPKMEVFQRAKDLPFLTSMKSDRLA